ncbi:MAG: hypothetical protein HZA53_18095 [Planctomycetes bacterium]|nr:hypothetical protein [Planctomycetota bacterium]
MRAILTLVALAFACVPSVLAQCRQWTMGFTNPGVDGRVNALAVFDEGAGPKLFLAGAFTHADGVAIDRIARWDGAAFTPLGAGLDGEVTSLLVFDDGTGPALYAGGAFGASGTTSALSVARWNGTSWSAVGAGFDQVVLALAVHDDGTGPALHAGGVFTHSGATLTRRLAKWTGTSWVEVGGGTNAPVDALASHQGALYAGGEFSLAGATSVLNVACWNGTSWSALGPGFAGAVLALASFDDGTGPKLYAGGEFGNSGATFVNHVAQWNGTSWTPLGAGVSSFVRCFLPEPGVGLRVGGDFFGVGAISSLGVALWTGSTWVANGGTRNVRALTRSDDGSGGGAQLYSGGAFQSSTYEPFAGVARFDGAAWQPVGAEDGLQGVGAPFLTAMTVVRDAAPNLDGLYAVGGFHTAGDTIASRVARYDGERWHALGAGLNTFGVPRCVAAFDGGAGLEVYVGGSFSAAGGAPALRVARWNGVAWQSVGSGTNEEVFALRVHDDGSGSALYAGGYFTQAGGVPASRVARWNGTSWSAVGAGLPAPVLALAVFDDGAGAKLYAGGGTPGVVSVWDGTTWTAIGTGLAHPNPLVSPAATALAVHDDGSGPALYASGTFTLPFPHLARWNGTSWSDVGGGLADGLANAIVARDEGSGGGADLYATGDFTLTGGSVGATRIARWDGAGWRALGSGLGGTGRTFASFGSDLFIGGDFSSAGPFSSRFIARWKGCGPVSSFCAGDGLDAHVTTACPCGNSGAAGRGCAWHAGPNGAVLVASGATNPDALVLTASGMPASAPSTIFLKGDALIEGGVVFGDGVRCVGGTLIRLGTKVNAGGAASYPEAGNVPISVRGNTPPGSGLVGYYQTYYRNAAVYCTSSTFNVTNGIRVEW